jgi:hypothetical protein
MSLALFFFRLRAEWVLFLLIALAVAALAWSVLWLIRRLWWRLKDPDSRHEPKE